MFILSQGKKGIFNLDNIATLVVSRNYGEGKEKKFSIVASGVILGFYPDEGAAQKELVKILAAIENDEKVYEL
ncbi:MAG: hypothetical protein K2G25_00880 [Oscillospiraceae bacterium]|nr:hypothetical protein [Oscillospiraceae bacterium]